MGLSAGDQDELSGPLMPMPALRAATPAATAPPAKGPPSPMSASPTPPPLANERREPAVRRPTLRQLLGCCFPRPVEVMV
jgi:hypothetical protein